VTEATACSLRNNNDWPFVIYSTKRRSHHNLGAHPHEIRYARLIDLNPRVKLGMCVPRAERLHVDAGSLHLERQAFDEDPLPGLCRVVVHVAAARKPGRDRRHVDDDAATSCNHSLYGGLSEAIGGQHVNAHHGVLRRARRIGECALGAKARVIDQEVDGRPVDAFYHSGHVIIDREVGRQDFGSGTVSSQQLRPER